MGREDIAEPLQNILPYVLSQDANVEILTLLLALSDRPTQAAEFDEAKFVVEEVVEKNVTWDEILAEEPFVGDHWKEPEFSGSEEEDWVYETKPQESPKVAPVEIKKKEEAPPVQEKSTLIEDFLQQQYWLRRQKYVILNEEYSPEFDFGGISL